MSWGKKKKVSLSVGLRCCCTGVLKILRASVCYICHGDSALSPVQGLPDRLALSAGAAEDFSPNSTAPLHSPRPQPPRDGGLPCPSLLPGGPPAAPHLSTQDGGFPFRGAVHVFC